MSQSGTENATVLKKIHPPRGPRAFRNLEQDQDGLSRVGQTRIGEDEPTGGLRRKPGLPKLTKREQSLLDKVGERLAFEHSATRLWQAFRDKFQALGDTRGEIDLKEIEKIRDEGLNHFLLLQKFAEELGADLRTISPGADVAGIQSMGLFQTLADPRTNLDQCLQAMLVAELVDNDAWQTLCDLTEMVGSDGWVEKFRRASSRVEEHLACVRTWIFDRTVNVSSEEDYSIEVTTVIYDDEDEDEIMPTKPAARRKAQAKKKTAKKKVF